MNRHLTLAQMSASVDDELSGVARELVERHLGECPGCDAVMARLVRLDTELRAVIADEPGEEFFEEMLALVRGRTEALEEEALARRAPVAAAPRAAPRLAAPAPPPGAPRGRAAPAPVVRPGRIPTLAAGAIAIPLVMLAAFALLVGEPGRELRSRLHLTGRERAAADSIVTFVPAAPAAAPRTSVYEPVLELPPAPPEMTPVHVESAAVRDEPPPAAPARDPRAAAHREPELARAAPEGSPVPSWTTRRETRVVYRDIAPITAEVGVLAGEVVDPGGRPVAAARVSLSGVEVAVATDEAGRFAMSVPAGDRTLTVRASGFAPWRAPVAVTAAGAERRVTLAPR